MRKAEQGEREDNGMDGVRAGSRLSRQRFQLEQGVIRLLTMLAVFAEGFGTVAAGPRMHET